MVLSLKPDGKAPYLFVIGSRNNWSKAKKNIPPSF
jgi:hypothetical protein